MADALTDVFVYVCVPTEACDTFVVLDIDTEITIPDTLGTPGGGDISDSADPLVTKPALTPR